MALYPKGQQPPSPGPDHIWITTKEGGLWRRKRGTVKKTTLNRAFKEGSSSMQLSSPAASRIIKKLTPYMNGLEPGRLHSTISGRLITELKNTGKLSLSCLKDLDLQQSQRLDQLMYVVPDVQQTAGELTVNIPIKECTVKRNGKFVTNYYFELVLLCGDISKERGLRTESVESDVYEIEKNHNLVCKLSMTLPEKEWIALLKVNSIDGDEPGGYNKSYAMAVVGTKN